MNRFLVSYLVFAGIFRVSLGQEDLKFLDDRIRCPSKLTFRTRFDDDVLLFYQNSSGTNELDCATKCYQKLQFCNSVRFDALSKRCLYSYSSLSSCALLKEDESLNSGTSSKFKVSPTIYCIRCETRSEKVTYPPTVRWKSTTDQKDGSAEVFLKADVSKEATSPSTEDEPEVKNGQPQFASVFKESAIESYQSSSSNGGAKANVAGYPSDKVNVAGYPSITSQKPTNNETGGYELRSKLNVRHKTSATVNPAQFSHILPVIKEVSTAEKLIIDYPTDATSQPKNCSSEFLLPCSNKFGRDCSLTTVKSCPICVCPLSQSVDCLNDTHDNIGSYLNMTTRFFWLGSPARGCSGEQGLNETGRSDLLSGKKKCPDGQRPQPVVRYKRVVDKAKNVDDCIATVGPYCGYIMDVSYWRMPRTKNECYYYCYSNTELASKGIDVGLLK